jgi:integrase
MTARAKLPRYVKWRKGRPRWELGGMGGQRLRDKGWISIDLKDSDKQWLSFEDATVAGDALNEAVDAWREGEAAPSRETLQTLIDRCPGGSAAIINQSKQFVAKPADDRGLTINHFIDAHLADMMGQAPGTRNNYTKRAKPLRLWLGEFKPHQIQPSHAQSFHKTLLDVSFWKDEHNQLRRSQGDRGLMDAHSIVRDWSYARKEALRERRLEAWDELEDHRDAPGYNMAYSVCNYASIMWGWARRHKNLNIANPFSDMDLTSPRGRVRYVDPAEVLHLIEVADANGLEHIGDVVIAALHTVQRGSDLIKLTWQDFDRGHFRITQKKGKKPVRPVVTDALRRRGIEMRVRQARLMHLKDPATVLGPMLRDAEGVPYTKRDQLTDVYAKLRAIAGETMPSLLDSKLHDMRDTGFTRAYMANDFDLKRACEISGHSLNSANMIFKSYLAQHPEIAERAAKGYDDWMASKGVKW